MKMLFILLIEEAAKRKVGKKERGGYFLKFVGLIYIIGKDPVRFILMFIHYNFNEY